MAKTAKWEPEVVALYCRNVLAEGVEVREGPVEQAGVKARLSVLPCSSRAEASQLLKVLAGGVDGIELVGCPDEQCKFLVGNVRAEKRIAYVRGLLDAAGVGAARLGMSRGERLNEKDLLALAKSRAEAVRPLGPNPRKRGNRP